MAKSNLEPGDYMNLLFDSALQDYNALELTDAALRSIYFANNFDLHRTEGNSNCSVEGCKNKAVMSHLFQESILKKISTDGHLLSPGKSKDGKKIELKRIGVSRALTFSGFCTEHEKLFTYEQNENITFEDESRLLVYKNICYHLTFLNNALAKMSKGIRKAIELRHDKFATVHFLKYEGAINPLGPQLKGMKFSDPLGHRLKIITNYYKNDLINLQNFKRLIWSDIQSNSNKRVKSYAVNLDVQIPICMAYFGAITMTHKGKTFEDSASFIIHPFKECTIIIISCRAKKFRKLKELLDQINAKEWMSYIFFSLVYLSDNWLINSHFYEQNCPDIIKELLSKAQNLPLSRGKTGGRKIAF